MEHAQLKSIHVHPVKAFRGTAPREAVVEPWGLAGDRRWALIDDGGKVVTQRQQPRLALAAAELLPGGGVRLSAPGMDPLAVPVPTGSGTVPMQLFRDKVEAVLAGDDAAHAWCSAFLGIDARLVYMDDPGTRRPVDPEYALPGETVSFADGYPLLVTTTASLDALNSLIARGDHADEGPLPMNRFRPNVVVSGTSAWAEDDWSRIAIGEVTFRVPKKCGRCVVTTTDQATTERGREPLHTLGRHRRLDGKLVFGQNMVPLSRGTIRVGDPVTILG
ncbi:molybdenum cofactor biosysynthesis protein [Streptomyces viridochromogenes]|uniref:Molybdenum cofactor biosysynthesis protein n=1 Tax=Streptomyces viridochromogenes TaxID=1938 RepID=A0A0J7Z532_STRVR|nr:MOSC N-terminal beta barrel domain-containing protein [Streptomyces viridochromogenes]KMS70874.1 molybdenum cofactor biosysynthesis protein [Streptomyces viridochromogenes]KOG11652.1 molybdenum cofactor biosysynthesis protein [Streptomyces viridochromogenes]KOG17283.1 molybdenum cofactor biosysynthesis protein [Streptomyces viridochromogenes]